ncbi:GEVED domain-containing protein [Flavobacterium magnum]|uniref:Ig-like domain-containing protein n=1 Tax=Flavobacterium magnum TaxID=2162713 RepID=UPI0015E7B731|nr:GEVED domain-containing protein [Flavobacterium magnum]
MRSGRDTWLKNDVGDPLGSPPTTSKRLVFRFLMTAFFMLSFLFLGGSAVQAQTTVISPSGSGSFEGANFAADGWTTVQLATPGGNNLALGNAATIGFTPTHGTKGVFVTNNGTSRGYAHASSWAWIYKDVTLAAGETIPTFTMDMFGNPGDTGFDGIVVGISDQTFTASNTVGATGSMSGTAIPGMTIATVATSNTFIEDGNYAVATTRTFTLSGVAMGNSLSSSTKRIWIGWRCDGSVGNLTTPMSFDRVNFVTAAPANFTAVQSGLFSSPATWGGTVPAPGNSITIPAGATITVDQALNYSDLTINGTLQWGSSSNSVTIGGNVLINSGGKLLAYTAATTPVGITMTIGGNYTNNGYANHAVGTGTLATLTFNGSGSTLGGTGTFAGDGTRGIIRQLFFQNNGSNTINTTQNLTVYNLGHTGTSSLNTNGKLAVDNTAQYYGQAANIQVANVAVTNMGSGYTSAPIPSCSGAALWTAAATLSVGNVRVTTTDIYVVSVAGTSGTSAPVHTSGAAAATGGTAEFLWVGPAGTIGTPYTPAALVVGTQYFYGGNLYTAVATTAMGVAGAPVHTTGTVGSLRYVGTPAMVSANWDATTSTLRSLNLVNAGSGYSSSTGPAISIVANAAGTGAAATAVVLYTQNGPTASSFQKSGGGATVSGGLTINSDAGAGLLTSDVQASSGVATLSTTNGGNNYTVAPVVGFAGPTQVNLVTNAGTGYTAAPTITVTGGNLVTGTALTSANFTITVNNGNVASVYLNTGTTATYSTPPTLSFTGGGGSGATLAFPSGSWPAATANIGANGQLTSFTVTNSGYGYAAAPTVGVGTASGTANGGTFTTVATAPVARVALYNLTLNFFAPATSAVVNGDDAAIPTNRKINTLSLNGNGNGLNITSNLVLYGTTPLALVASGNTPGNILNMGGNTVTCTTNGFAGLSGTVGATNSFVKNGSFVLTGRGGASVFNFPFGGTVTWSAGSGTLATGSNVLTAKVSDTAAPTNAVTGGTGLAMGTRAYRVQTATTLGAAATTGTNPTILVSFNGTDALTTTQDQTFLADATSLNGPWTIRSTAFGASGALPTASTKTTATSAPGPIVHTGDNYYAWATPAATITDFSPLTVCASSGTFTITGTNFTGVTAVSIGGTPVSSFTIVNATTITGTAGTGTTGVASVTKNGATISGVQTVTVTGSPTAPGVSPTSASIITGGAVSFTATGTGGTMKWYDAATGGTLLFTGDTYNTNICTTRTLYVAEDNGSCEGARASVTVTVQPIVVSATTSTFCGTGATTTLSVTPTDPSITYTWTALTTSASLSATTGNSVDATVSETSEFKVTATTTLGGCSVDAFYSVGVYPLPTATVTTSATGVCPGTSATINSGLSAGNFTAACITPAPKTAPGTVNYLANNGVLTTALTSGTADDGGWGNIPLGFSFNFFGTNYTNVNVGTNAVLQFGTYNATALGDFTIGALPNTVDPLGAIFAGSNDLRVDQTGGAGPATYVRYWTEGYAPNRRFVIEYNVFQWTSGLTSTNRHNVQVIVYETLGTVDIIAKEVLSTNSKSIGVNSPTGTIGAAAPNCTTNAVNFWSGTTATISAASPQAWRFSPPSNYTTTWFANGVQFVTGTNLFSQVVSPSVTTTYSITYTNQTTLCTNSPGSAQVVMSVLGNTPPTGVNTLSSSPTVCAGFTATLSTDYAGSTAGLTYQWQSSPAGAGTWTDVPGAVADTMISSPINAPTDFRLGISSCGGTVGYTNPVTVNLTNSISSTSGATRCGVGTVSLTASGTPGASINWYAASSGGTPLFTGSPYTPSLSSTVTYYVAAETPGCTSPRVAVSAVVNPAPALTLSSSSADLCVGQTSSTVTITSNVADYNSYVWNPSTGVSGSEITGWTFSPSVTTVYTLTATEPGGCTNQATFTANVDALPVDATADLTTVCAGFPVALSASTIVLSSGPAVLPTGYCSPDSSGGGGSNPITSVVFNTLSNTGIVQTTPFFDTYPATGTTTTTVTAGQTYNLTVSAATSILSVWIDWNRNGDLEDSEWQQVWTSASSGTLPILVPSNAVGGYTKMRLRSRGSGNPNGASDDCSAFFSGTSQDYTINVIGAVEKTGLDYSWSPGGATTQNIIVNPTSTTTYTVTATNPLTGCSNTDSILINVNPIPIAPTGVDSSQCGNQVPTASVSDNNAFTTPTFKWYADNVTTTALQSSTSTTYTTAINATTTFYVSVVNPGTGCESSRTPVTITVSNADAIMASPSSSTVCPGGSVSVNVTSTNSNYTYTWTALPSTGSGITGSLSGASNSITPTLSGTYTYTVNAVDGPCSTFTTFTITATANPVLTAGAVPAAVCNNGISTLTAAHPSRITFSTSTGAALDPMVGATDVLTTDNDDTPTAAPAAIGFTFNFNGVDYSDYSVSPDGWILLGAGSAVDEFSNSATSTANIPKLYPYWDDMATGTDGNVKTLVTGSAPNRIFIVEWNTTVPRSLGGAANAKFQAWLYETSNKIEYRYGTMSTTTGSATAGYTVNGTTFSNITFTSNTESKTTANNNNTGVPASGRMYTYLQEASTVTWSPSTDLYTDAGATIPYAGQNLAVVYSKPAVTTTYTATATGPAPANCTTTQNVTVTNNSINIAAITGGANDYCIGSPALDFDTATPGVTWTSSNPAVATVDASGVVTALTAGTTIIGATITNAGCTTVAPNPQTVVINDQVQIVSFTASQTVVTLGNTSFNVNATGTGLTYQWQVNEAPGFTGFVNVVDDAIYSGAQTATLNLTAVPASFNGNLYHVVVSGLGVCAPKTSNPDSPLTVGDTGITTHPTDVTICETTTVASFSVVASGDDSGGYQWQEQVGGTGPWTNITNGGIYSGATTPTLSLSGLTVAQSTNKYRAVVTGAVTSANSNPATLTINQSITVQTNPSNANVCFTGGSASFSSTATGLISSRQWQYSTNGVSGWASVVNGTPAGATYTGNTTGTLNVTTTAATPTTGHYYRLFYDAPLCADANSTAAQMIIFTPSATSPGTQNFCAGVATSAIPLTGTGTTFNISGGAAIGLANQTGVTSIPSFTPIAGTATITITPIASGCTGPNTTFTINVNGLPGSPTTGPTAPVCEGSPLTLTSSTVTIPGYTMNGNSGVSFIDISATGTSVTGALGDDSEHNITMPAFTFNGTAFTTARVGMNGAIVLGATTGEVSFSNAALPSTAHTAGNVFLAPFWDDLDIQSAPTIKTQTVGNIFIIQYTSADHNDVGLGDGITFQVQLNLTSGAITYVYQDVSFGTGATGQNAGASATIGIQMSSSSAVQFSNNTASLTNGQSITFTPNSASYSWTGPNGFSSNQQNPTVTATASAANAGTYTLTVTNVATGCQKVVTQNVTVTPAPAGGTLSNQTACYNSTPDDILLAGSVGSVVKWQKSSDLAFTSPQDIANTTTTLTGAQVGNITATTYVRAVVQSGSCGTTNSAVATITPGNQTTWTVAGGWSNGAPTSTSAATINGNFTAVADLNACSLTIQSGTVSFPGGFDAYVSGKVSVNGGTITFEDGSDLVQTRNDANTGNIKYKRTANLIRQDYVYWSSPVSGQLLQPFSPNTLNTRFYTLDESSNGFSQIASPSTTSFDAAKGYMIRAANNHPAVLTPWTGTFTGTPRNGEYTIPVTVNGQGYNMIGNPYPSTVDADLFLAEPGNAGTLYFWTHISQAAASGANYASYNTFGGTAAQSGGSAPTGAIRGGQGFILLKSSASTARFTNAMRTAEGGAFYRNAQTAEKHRMWFNLNTPGHAMNQILVGYAEGATMGEDIAMDGKSIEGGSSISTLIGSDNYVIQARSLPFVDTDVVPMGFTAATAGTYIIELDHVDGLFSGDQNIYLKDNLLGVTHNIKQGAYSFASAEGTFANRFEVVYQSSPLGVDTPTFDANSVVVYKNQGMLHINSGKIVMSGVKIFDVRGRLIYERGAINASETVLNDLRAEEQVLLVQITSVDNEVVTKKVAY